MPCARVSARRPPPKASRPLPRAEAPHGQSVTADRYTKIVLTVIAGLLAHIAYTLHQYRPVVSADFEALARIEDHDDRTAAAKALLQRRHMIYVHDGRITIDRVDDTVDVRIEP